jgi:RND family efflux transporter MFP subunit
MKRVVFVIVMVVLAGLLGWQVYVRAQARAAALGGMARRGRPVVPVEVVPVETGTIRDVAQFTGSLLPHSEFVVSPKVPGRLEKLLVNIGDSVTQGQQIALLDDEEYVLQVDQAQAELEVAQANVEEARSALEIGQREFQRVQALREKGIASASDLDSAQASLQAQTARQKVAAAQVSQKKAALQAAQVRQSYTRIKVAWQGGGDKRYVGERFVDEGALLRANDPIVSILDLSSLTAALHVIERDYSKVQVGQAVTVTTDAYPDKTFPGTVVRVAPLLKETSRQARVEVDLPNPDALLKPGMFVRAEIEFGRVEDARIVPTSAVARRDNRQGVFLADAAKKVAHFVPIVRGIQEGDRTQVAEPALSGMIVTMGHHLLEDGSSISIVSGEGGPESSPGGGQGQAGSQVAAPERARP